MYVVFLMIFKLWWVVSLRMGFMLVGRLIWWIGMIVLVWFVIMCLIDLVLMLNVSGLMLVNMGIVLFC